jgi:fructose-bisphosphate aldolase class 1
MASPDKVSEILSQETSWVWRYKPVIPAIEVDRSYSEAAYTKKKKKHKTLSEIKPKAKRTQVVEHLPSKYKALSSNPTTPPTKKKRKKWHRGCWGLCSQSVSLAFS